MTTAQQTYHINEKTLAILSTYHPEYASIVFEGDDTFYVKERPTKLIERACLDGGSTFDGRRKAVSFRTNIHKKVPIPIYREKNIYAFPTHSPSLYECSWIFQSHINVFSAHPTKRFSCTITFTNGRKIELPVSYYSIKQQYQRTAICMLRFSPVLSER